MESYYRLAVLAYRRGAIDEAQNWLSKMHAGIGGHQMPAPALNLLGGVYRSQGKMTAALAALTEAVQQEDGNLNYLINLARLQAEAGCDPQRTLEKIYSKDAQRWAELKIDPVLKPFVKE